MSQTVALDTTIEVVTPENIAFKYQLAGPFRRLPAFLIDVMLRFAIIFGLGFCLILIVGLSGLSFLGVFAFAAMNIAWFLIWWMYGVAMETWFNGRTVGKMVMKIRVVTSTGHPISGVQAMLRNLICVADLAPLLSLQLLADEAPPVYIFPTGVCGLIVMLSTRRMQRLGDLAAGTMVVIDERGWVLPVQRIDDRRVPALASYVPPSFRVSPQMAKTLALYVERRVYLGPGRRRELAQILAEPLIDQFAFRKDIDPDLLLYALYWRTYLSDSRDEVDLGDMAGFSPLAADIHKLPAAPLAPSPPVPPTPVGVDMARINEDRSDGLP